MLCLLSLTKPIYMQFLRKILVTTVIGALLVSATSSNCMAGNKEPHNWKGTHETSISVGLPRTNLFMNIASPLNFSPMNGFSRDRNNRANLPVFGIDYGYNVLSWLNVGLGFNYTYYETPIIDDRSDAVSFNERINSMQLMVRLRFYWLNREKVRLYSAVGAGILIQHGNMLDMDRLPDNPVRTEVVPWFDLCAIGVTVGRRLYGNFQLGAMSAGLISAGIGYRF